MCAPTYIASFMLSILFLKETQYFLVKDIPGATESYLSREPLLSTHADSAYKVSTIAYHNV